MNLTDFGKYARITAFAAAVFLTGATTSSWADSLTVTYLAAGVQAPTGITSNYETFDNASIVGGTLTTTFNGSGITGTYSGNFTLLPADGYGGAGGSGKYISSVVDPNGGRSYTLTLSAPVDYFGLWFSAVDPGNRLTFYKGDTLVDTFSALDFLSLVGSCPNASNAFCGNPNDNLDTAEQFAYLNFYDPGQFDTIVFSESRFGAALESDNHAIGNVPVAPGGTIVRQDPGSTSAVPEPGSLLLAGSGVLGLAGFIRRSLASRSFAR